ncbi:hypothetical protein HPY28_15870 [Brevibacillus sp. HB1.2]|uniref:Transposase n=1 Tax=Brevibacillus porteri TaxID=2126350 RepID=A0ABX5FMT0_9BACL|nr:MULTISPECIES: hypothetical protein [Brevibacillus]ATF15903.1 hypothetical protein A616_29335 [Brevibacillus brevis X23]MED1801479.1 hypothetical protein [Brevibacillus porteri]MED2133818.1 hypothetical protein [Brevibacillus porteri]MED2748224.1 hypothetical protein [Brevibacillus porteri]MED2815362.1 hypothetical protein [Brevibacillus porteri]
MRTSVNVMGIQTKNIMERISVTLKAVLKTGKENKKVQLIEKEEGIELPRVISAQDPVFEDKRLIEEIPEPNWNEALIAPPNGMVDRTRESPLAKKYRKTHNWKRQAFIKQAYQLKASEARRTHLHLVAVPQTENKQPHEIRDLRSSPSPPVAT